MANSITNQALHRSWAVAIAVFAAHNLEETITFANGWAIHHMPELSWTAEQWHLFGGAAAAMTLIAGLIAWCLRDRPKQSVFWLRIFLAFMLVNAVWHVGVAVVTTSIAPGVTTAVLLVIPVYAVLLCKLFVARRGE